MRYLKNLLFALFVLFPAFAWSSEYTLTIKNGVVIGYEYVPPPTPAFTANLPDGFPSDCLRNKRLTTGASVECQGNVTTRKYFSFRDAAILTETQTTVYTMTLDETGKSLTITAGKPEMKTEKFFGDAFVAFYSIAILFAILAFNNVDYSRWKLLASYGGTILGVIAGGLTGIVTSNEATATLVGVFVGGIAGALTSGLLFGALAGGFAGMIAGVSAGRYGWEGGGINDYLLFLVILSIASLALREIIAIIWKHRTKPTSANKTS